MADGRSRLSGHQYKKRRLEKDAERQKQAGALESFLKKGELNKPSTPIPETNAIAEIPLKPREEHTSDSNTICEPGASTSGSSAMAGEAVIVGEGAIATPSVSTQSKSILDFDPATWPNRLTDAERIYLVNRGPPDPLHEFEFPQDINGRRFTSRYYKRKLNNGEEILRDWLVYSVAKNSLYCFCCKIFNTTTTSGLSEDGYKNWKHVGDMLKSHETSRNHVEAVKSWVELLLRLKSCRTIDADSQRIIKSEIEHWNGVLLRIVSIIKMLAKNGLAFQGTSDNLYQHNNGNFLKLIELLAEFDPVMQEHVRRVLKKDEKQATYLSKTIQNEFIKTISDGIKKHIVEAINTSKYYSIILDCTPDASKTEQMTMIIRYISIIRSQNHSRTSEIVINESFLGFIPIEKSTGLALTEIILEQLSALGLSLENIRGQGYDNGSNMKGIQSGVQARIRNINPRAFYVPCSSHSLNLVVNDMAKSSLEATIFFNTVQKIYVFFSSSTLRWSILLNNVKGLTLKPLSDTRWESRIEAIKPLRHQVGQVYDALFSVYQDTDMDSSTRDEASSLLNQIKQFKFLCSIIIWYETLNRINPVSKLMQSKDFDLVSVIKLLKNTKDFFENSRSDEYFTQVLEDAKALASEIDCEVLDFENVARPRARSKKKQFTYECIDEPIIEPRQKYKIEVFFHIMDTAINSLELRFSQISEHSKHFAFLYNIYALRELPKDKLLEHCKNLEAILTHENSSDINALELYEELSVLSMFLNSNLSPQDVLKFVTDLRFGPNISIALRILLTLPVTVASGERSFSKLKIIKKYLRSTMTQNRLSGLAMISIEHKVCDSINLSNIVKDFAEQKVRRKLF